MRIKLYIFLWCSPLLLFSQLSLERAVSIGLVENLNIQVQRKNLEAANENHNPGVAGLYPSLSVGGSYNYTVGDFTQQLANESTERTFDAAVSEIYSADVTVNYTLFDGLGRINNYRRLGLQKDLSEAQLRFTIENTLLQVYSSYFEVARLDAQRKVAQEAVVLSMDRYNRTKAAFEIGGGGRLDFLSAQVDLNTDSVALLNAEAEYSKRLRTLSQVLNFSIDTTYTVDTTVAFQSIDNYMALKQSALSNNAALIQAEYNRQISKKDIAIAWSAYAPNISASGGYQFSRQDNEGSFLQFTQNQGWQGGITARWTLFNGNRTKTQIELAQINLDRSTIEVDAAKQQLEVDLSNAWIDYQNSQRVRTLEKKNLNIAKLNFERSQEAYQLGQINNTQLREAQLNYINTKVRYKNLGFTLKVAEVELLRVGGLLLTE